jgi:transcriptional regulator, MarR family
MDLNNNYEDIDHKIIRIMYQITHKCITSAEDRMRNQKITFPQSVILHIIFDNEDKDFCQNDIVNILGIKGSSISSLINNMSKNGLIVRRTCSDDARKCIIKGTEKGRQIFNEVEADLKSDKRNIFDRLESDEKKQLLNILSKII